MIIKTKYNIGDTLFFKRSVTATPTRFVVFAIDVYVDDTMKRKVCYRNRAKHKVFEYEVIGSTPVR